MPNMEVYFKPAYLFIVWVCVRARLKKKQLKASERVKGLVRRRVDWIPPVCLHHRVFVPRIVCCACVRVHVSVGNLRPPLVL